MSQKIRRLIFLLSPFVFSAFFAGCSTKSVSQNNPSAADLPKTEDIIIQDSTSNSSSSMSATLPPETQKTARFASVWIEAVGTEAFMALGFLQELEKHLEIVSVNGIGFGCWVAMSWASENRGSYAEWQSFKWDSWDLLGSNILNRVIGRSNADSFKSRLESRMPLKNKDHYKVPMACPFVYAKQKDFTLNFQNPIDLPVHEELWIQMRNTFYFPMADIEKDERKSGFFRGPVRPDEFIKFTPPHSREDEHVWIVLSSEVVRREMRRGPQPEIQRGIINDTRWIKKILAPNDYSSVSDAKELKKKRSMLLRGRKEGKQFFENPAVTEFLGFGSL